MKKLRRVSGELTVLGAALLTIAFLAATSASAHVTVAAPGVAAGASDAVITFHVPDESDTASTVGLKVQLPATTPIAGVLVAPVPGWTAKITQTKLATPIKTDDGDITEIVSEIDWTAAAGDGIAPGFFGEFTIIGGKLPDDAASLTFKAIQTYSDKSVVSWIDEAAPGSTAELDHPAPVLTLAAASSTPSASNSTAPSSTASSSTAPSVSAAASSSDSSSGKATTGLILGIVGIVLGAGALLVALRRGRPQTGQ
ncbi:MAG: hypothetical protein JWN95_3596 [Frankiales bacterium]|nr:hypothetical protein [Frankiales bacterium]